MDAIARLLANPGDLPVRGALPEVRAAVERAGVAVLTAPPGSGKTTLVPPLLADIVRAGAGAGAGSRARAGAGAGRIVVTQPRRIAARAAARRLASLLGQEVGGDVGVTVRGESRTSPRTRVEVVTTGVLLRRLQRDPALPGVAGVVLDEVHERSLESDLVLAMVADVRETLREDLRVVVMSATLDAAALGAAWDAPVVVADGALHEVDTVWCPPERPLVRSDERGVRREYLQHVIAVARRAVAERAGDVLVFVPGAREVDDVVAGLRRAPLGGVAGAEDTADGRRSEEPEVLPLHGRLSAAAQDRALRAGGRRRVVVSTAVAESSLTVPGVRVVVDAGLARQPRTDHRRGLAGLVTVMVSRAGAEQRAGRAGREGPGAVYRCWSEAEHARLARFAEPEVATADLASFVLEAACWSRDGVAGLRLPDAPPRAALEAAEEVLRGLGALDGDGVVTARGRAIAGVPTD
ncbi:MAG TPA: ATP-dependent helicase HrpB, partial [Micrococcales bacterium]|uniref:helicase-related protein n=1 Tax=Miniimonas arenae TaxID=676201 RepID=UPI000EE36C25